MLKILVCVRQVPDPEYPFRIDASRTGIEPLPRERYRMNRYDEFALEEALRIREAFPGARIDAISVGPERAARTVERALAMGADEGIHILLGDDRYRMPRETASLISAYAGGEGYDLILAGVMAEDDMQGQVGPMVAVLLDYPWSTAVMSQKLAPNDRRVDVERELEGGRREAFALDLPALLTVQSGINRPRYPALSHVLRARSQPLVTIDEKAIAPPEAWESLVCLEEPAPAATCTFLSGSAPEKAEQLVRLFREKAFL